jgi:hypothetical protein
MFQSFLHLKYSILLTAGSFSESSQSFSAATNVTREELLATLRFPLRNYIKILERSLFQNIMLESFSIQWLRMIISHKNEAFSRLDALNKNIFSRFG